MNLNSFEVYDTFKSVVGAVRKNLLTKQDSFLVGDSVPHKLSIWLEGWTVMSVENCHPLL